MAFILAAMAVTASCVPADSPKLTKLEVTNAFFTALNAHDQTALGPLIKPGARIVMGPGDSLDLAELLGMMPPEAKLEVKDMRLDDTGDVVVKTHSSDGTAATGVLKFEGGCISALEHRHGG